VAELPPTRNPEWLSGAEWPSPAHNKNDFKSDLRQTIFLLHNLLWEEVSIPDKMLMQFSVNFNGIKVCSRKPITPMPNYPQLSCQLSFKGPVTFTRTFSSFSNNYYWVTLFLAYKMSLPRMNLRVVFSVLFSHMHDYSKTLRYAQSNSVWKLFSNPWNTQYYTTLVRNKFNFPSVIQFRSILSHPSLPTHLCFWNLLSFTNLLVYASVTWSTLY
jgi:hypothetical protein